MNATSVSSRQMLAWSRSCSGCTLCAAIICVCFARNTDHSFPFCSLAFFAHCRSAVVGEIDEDVDAELSLDEILAEPLKPVTH